jgi:hypothetical protein
MLKNIRYKLFLVIVMILATGHINGEANDFIKIDSLKFSIEKNNSWVDISEEGFRENLKGVKFDSKEFTDLVQKYAATPFLSFQKEMDDTEVNPSFNITFNDNKSMDLTDPVKFIKKITSFYKFTFKNYKVVKEPEYWMIDGVRSSHMVFSYTLLGENDSSFEVTSAVWVIPRNKHHFIIGSGFGSENETVIAEISAMVKSIKVKY